MNTRMKTQFKRMLSIFMSLLLCVLVITGCTNKAEEITPAVNQNEIQEDISVSRNESGERISNEEIANLITEEIQNFTEDFSLDADSVLEEGEKVEKVDISDDWNDYIGDIDTFVYGLILNQYQLVYDTFNAMIVLPDGSEIYGIAYTDYDTYFESDDNTGFFSAGFLGLIGEESLSKEYENEGLEIINLDYDDPDCKFVYAYDCDDYMEHCVIWNHYLQYGVKSGTITYDCTEFDKDKCDERIGALYSYDEERYLYDPDVGEFFYVKGVSLSDPIDFEELEAKVNRILEDQDKYFADADVESAVYIAQEALQSYWLSMQEETFMGYNVSDLIEASKNLDPMGCIQLTPDGTICINASETIPENSPTEFTKWMTGICCGLVVVGCVAVDIFIPALVPLSGAIMSSAIEVFTEVVMQNNQIQNVNWAKVGVAAVSGALIAWACPAVASSATSKAVSILGKTFSQGATTTISTICGYAVLAFSNGLVAGSTNAAFAYFDGQDSDDILDAFVLGAVVGGAMTIAASVMAEAGSAAMNAFNKAHPNNWLAKAGDKVSTFIGEHQVHLKNAKLEDVLVPKSIHQAAESAWEELYANERPLFMERIDQLPADDNSNGLRLVDKKNNPIKKSDVYTNKGDCRIDLSECKDENVIKAINAKGGGDYTYLEVDNGVVDMGKFSDGKFVPRDGITSNREVNMNNYYKDLAENNNKIPDTIMSQMKDAGVDSKSATQVEEFIKTKWTLHETESGYVEFVDKYVHGVVGHYGGVARAKALNKVIVVQNYFKQLSTSSAIAVSGTLFTPNAA